MMTMFRRVLLALACAALVASPAAGAQANITVTAGDAAINVVPPGAAIGQLMWAEGVAALSCRLDGGAQPGGYIVTAQVQNPLPLTPNGVHKLIRLQVSLDGGAYAELVNQLGQAQPASALGVVSIPLHGQTYSWTANYRATMYAEGFVAVGGYVFHVLFTFIGQ